MREKLLIRLTLRIFKHYFPFLYAWSQLCKSVVIGSSVSSRSKYRHSYTCNIHLPYKLIFYRKYKAKPESLICFLTLLSPKRPLGAHPCISCLPCNTVVVITVPQLQLHLEDSLTCWECTVQALGKWLGGAKPSGKLSACNGPEGLGIPLKVLGFHKPKYWKTMHHNISDWSNKSMSSDFSWEIISTQNTIVTITHMQQNKAQEEMGKDDALMKLRE